MRRVLFVLLLVFPLRVARADALWHTLLPTPPQVAGEQTGRAHANGVSFCYTVIGTARQWPCCTCRMTNDSHEERNR